MKKKKSYPAQQPSVHRPQGGFTPSRGVPFQSNQNAQIYNTNQASILRRGGNVFSNEPLRPPQTVVDTGKLKSLMTLYIEHVPTGYWIEFPAYLEGYSDAYNSEWSSEQVYGRMDPIATFAHTRRALSLAWNVPASSIQEAVENMDKINTAVSFLYPLYDDAGSDQGAILNMGPLWRIKFGNLVHNAANGGPLLGYVNGITVDPLLEEGMFTVAAQETGGQMYYYPKTVRLNVELVVLHEHNMGWKMQGETPFLRGGKQGFPYATKQPLTTHSVNSVRANPSFDPNSPGNAQAFKSLDNMTSRSTTNLSEGNAGMEGMRLRGGYTGKPTIFED